MKILIGIISCRPNAYLRQCQRETWIPAINPNVDYKFFLATGSIPQGDEIILECPDDYTGLPTKVRAMCRWALANEYDYLFKCDDDTYIRPERLLDCGFESHDYMGRLRTPTGAWKHHYALGGPGYWLSKRAIQAIASAELTEDTIEDRWVGNTLHDHGIDCNHSDRFVVVIPMVGADPTPRPVNKLITACELHGDKMLAAHKIWRSGLPENYVNDRMFGDVRRSRKT